MFTPDDEAKLATVHSKLVAVAREVDKTRPHRILQGFRNQADQEAAFAAGNTTKHWPDGNHNQNPSRAIDVMPLSTQPGDQLNWKDMVAFGRLAGYYQACADRLGIKLRFGLDWDGDWRSVGLDPDEHFMDAPHIELAKEEL